MKPASGSRFGRARFQIVYVNSFGRHRSGNVIHYSGDSSGRQLRQQEKLAVTNTRSCCLTAEEALPPISDRMGSGGAAASSPSSKASWRSPCSPRATSTKQDEGACERGPLSKAGQAKKSKARKVPQGKKTVTERPPPLNPEQKRKRGDLNFPASTGQKQIGMIRAKGKRIHFCGCLFMH